MKNKKLLVQDTNITIKQFDKVDFISLTDIARYKDAKRSDYILQNWMRSKDTIEFLGLWERINNDNFNSIEFDGIKNQAGVNSFILTPKQWRDENSDKDGNVRDYASVEQLIVLSNLESLNSLLIKQDILQYDRLVQLNQIAISQIKSLVNNKSLKKLINAK
jgi:hypothetical protein